MTTKCDIIKGARELISDPSRWTRGAYARDKDGNSTNSGDPEAVCFCTVGAIRKVGRELKGDFFGLEDDLGKIAHSLYPEHGSMIGVNDDLGHEAALAVLDKALEECQP